MVPAARFPQNTRSSIPALELLIVALLILAFPSIASARHQIIVDGNPNAAPSRSPAGRIGVARDTGGFLTRASDGKVEHAFERIAHDLRAQYLIRYEVADELRSNEWRDVKVVVEKGRGEARTIRGYFTP